MRFIEPPLETILTPILENIHTKVLRIPFGICQCCGYPYGIVIKWDKKWKIWSVIYCCLIGGTNQIQIGCLYYPICKDTECNIKNTENPQHTADLDLLMQVIQLLIDKFSIIIVKGTYFLTPYTKDIPKKLLENQINCIYFDCKNKLRQYLQRSYTVVPMFLVFNNNGQKRILMTKKEYVKISSEGVKYFGIENPKWID